jgi:hypothetical protein
MAYGTLNPENNDGFLRSSETQQLKIIEVAF